MKSSAESRLLGGLDVRSIVLLFLVVFSATGMASRDSADALASIPTPIISIKAYPDRDWEVNYQFHKPVRQLDFARSPDKSRATTWTVGDEFEIVSTGHGEVARRQDGGSFTEVTMLVPPVYVKLLKDYAPFSPFGDGSTLFHTGRFFACADVCQDNAEWSMKLTVDDGRHILLDGKRMTRQANWTDSGDGRNVYVGETQPFETQHFIAVLDGALPSSIRVPLINQLPQYMQYFAERLDELPSRLVLFASYDASYMGGRGVQGGALPGQVFTHFYGKKYAEEMAKANFANDLAWFFAHEAAHLYQRQIFSADLEGYWIHEGGAEAFAAMAIRAGHSTANAFVDSRIETARMKCAKSLKDRTVQEAINGGDFDAAYTCGLILNLAIDAALRRDAPDKDGLYAVWHDYIARSAEKDKVDEQDFLDSLARIGGIELADSVRRAVRTRSLDLDPSGPLAFLDGRQAAGTSR